MHLYVLMLAACAAPALAVPAHAAPVAAAAAEQRLPHISVEAVGKGAPVLLVPGLSTPREVWAGIVPQVTAKHRAHLVQVNGFGGDDPGANLKPGMLQGVVEDLHGYISGTVKRPVRLVGHSMGGLVGLMLAKKYPQDVESLMIVEALPWIGEIFVPGATVAMLEPQARAMGAAMAASHGKSDAAAAERVAATQALSPAARSKVAQWVAKADQRVAGAALYDDLTTDLRPAMGEIKTPITLIYPYSAKLPQERADALYRKQYEAAPEVRFVPIGDAGHFVMLDQPQEFAAALDQFLK